MQRQAPTDAAGREVRVSLVDMVGDVVLAEILREQQAADTRADDDDGEGSLL